VLLLFLVLPMGLQASAVMASCSVVPMLVVDTMKSSVDNFSLELNEYLAVSTLSRTRALLFKCRIMRISGVVLFPVACATAS